MELIQKRLNALIVFIICGILLGAFGVQFFEGEQPCPLCLLQRIGMIGVATGLLLNVAFGIQMTHYAISLLSCVFGGFVALRQIALHVCPGTPTFGLPVLGLSLYTWSFLVFVCSVLAIALLLFLYEPKASGTSHKPDTIGKYALILMLLIALGNVITTFLQCGFGPCAD